VLAIHLRQLAEHGGADGIRDVALLESAIARPRNLFAYSDAPGLAELAASYAYGISGNHPFVDGNKRVAWVVCRTFLRLNGHDVDASPEERYVMMLQVASSGLSEEALAAWIRDHLRKDS
jgi:death-on-curing protein